MVKPKIYYCFDPFCGWCYAFGETIMNVASIFNKEVDVEVMCGGMITGKRIEPLESIKDYLLNSIPEVEKRSKAKFGQPFIELLKEGTYVPNSMPPSIAIQVYKSLENKGSLKFAHEIQKSYFQYGEDIKSAHYYTTLASRFNLNPNLFIERWKHLDYYRKTESEFQMIRNLGVQGFPTVIAKMGEQWYLLSRGYVEEKQLINVIDQWFYESKIKQN